MSHGHLSSSLFNTSTTCRIFLFACSAQRSAGTGTVTVGMSSGKPCAHAHSANSADCDANRVCQNVARQSLDFARECRRKQERCTQADAIRPSRRKTEHSLWRSGRIWPTMERICDSGSTSSHTRRFAVGVTESQREHAIGFVENKERAAAHVGCLISQHVQQSTRSCDHDFTASLERFPLFVLVHAAKHGCRAAQTKKWCEQKHHAHESQSQGAAVAVAISPAN